MSKIIPLICAIAAIVLITNGAKAQVNVSPNSVNYTTLKAAFNAINAGTHTGAIIISISGNTTETDSCVINANGTGSASYNRITISPTGGAARTIQGNVNGNFIVFNGADTITINGLNTGGNSLTISNSSTGTLATTLRFFNDASNNIVTNTSIRGSSRSNTLGTIQFERGSITGNDNNTISNCDIGPVGSNLPFCAVYSSGASGSIVNEFNTITGCNLFDFFSTVSISYGIQLTNTGNSAWTITNNKFYQTASRTAANPITHSTISIGSGSGYIISGNTFGYASNSGTGVYTITGSVDWKYVGVNCAFSTGGSNRISNNIFRNFLINTSSGASTNNGMWCSIFITAGSSSIDSNIIGDGVSNNSITVISTINLGIVVPICSQTTSGNVSIQGNSIGSVTCKGSAADIGTGFTGVNVAAGGSGFSLTLANNIIGSNTQTNSIYSSDTLASATGGRIMTGINVALGWTGNVRIANNTVRNMTSGTSTVRYTGTTSATTGISCASVGSSAGAVSIDSNIIRDVNVFQSLTTGSTSVTTGILSSGSVTQQSLNIRRNIVRDIVTTSGATSFTLPAIQGIAQTGSSVLYNISDNQIFNLSCVHSTAANTLHCIFISGAGSLINMIARNLLYGTSIASSSSAAQHTGIYLANGGPQGYTIANNMISLGSSITADQIIYGIDEKTSSTVPFNIWFNSIYISGASSSNTARTSCLIRETSTSSWFIENNIFYNARTFTGAGNLGYGIIFNSTNLNLSLNYNNNYTPGVNGCFARNTALGTDYSTLIAWRTTNPSYDINSFSIDPLFINPSASTPDLHLQDPNPQSRAGKIISSILVDFDGATRPATAGQKPDIGADESNFLPTPGNMDFVAPVITFNSNLPLPNIVPAGSRTLTGFVKISDNGTLGSGANAPRIYYRRIGIDPDNFTTCFSGGNNSGGAAGWRYTSASGNTGEDYDFTMNFALFNGGSVSAGNQIGWFVAAQDLSTVTAIENFVTNQSGGIATVSPSINNLTSPFGTSTASYLFNISYTMSGVMTVGTGGTYPNLTGASGLFNAINTSVVDGNIYVSVLSNLVETGTVKLNEFSAPYTLQIRPSGSVTTRIIQGTTVQAFNPMIDLAGADRVSFNGADSATNTGQYFRFINNNSNAFQTGSVFRFVNDARRDSVRNCIIESNSTNGSVNTSSVVLSTTINSSGNDSISIDNCLFKQSAGTNPGRYYLAFGSTGTGSGEQTNSDNSITNCNFTGMLANSSVINVSGTGNGDNWIVSNNKFYNDINYSASASLIQFQSAVSNNVTISGNSIGGSAPDRSGTLWGTTSGFLIGINLFVGTSAASNIQGNTISNIGTIGGSSTSAITVGGGKVNIGTTSGNIIGGLANPWDTCITSNNNSGWINNSGSTDTVRIENNTIGNCSYYGGIADGNFGIYVSSGVNIIRNNLIRDIKGNNTGTLTLTSTIKGILVSSLVAGQIVEDNTIFNLQNTNTGTAAYGTSGIQFNSTTGLSTISRNRIYNITSVGTGTGVSAPVNIGINNSSTAVLNIINNQISLSASTLEPQLIGINNSSTGRVTSLYNSIYISGVCSNTANTSYCYLRNSTSNDTARNNIFFNERTGGANNYCIGITNTTNWTSKSANYNAYFPSSNNQVGVIGSFTQQTYANWKINSGGDASSVSATGVSSANLFTSTATGNLNINTANVECWYASGLGTPVTTPQVLNDYGTSSTVRSVSIPTGVTDIGSDEFLPIANPPDITSSGLPANSTTTTYTFMGRTLGSIDWGPGGTVPSDIEFKYYSGTNPPGSLGFPVGNGYWLITATGGSDFSYDITINYDDAILGEVNSEDDIRLSKSEDGGNTWNTFVVSGTAAGQYALDTANNTIKVYGLTSFSTFALSDATTPLPVELASFISYIDRRNVILKWSTISEQNNAGFDIERKESSSVNNWNKVGNVPGAGTSSSARSYIFTENNLNTGKYNYRLKQIDFNGNFKYHELAEEVEIGIPNKYEISQNYPNPFNPTTKINYDLPFDSKVQIKIYDMTGREVHQLVNQVQVAGYYTTQFNASSLASGVYFYQINATSGKQSFVKTMKMVLVK